MVLKFKIKPGNQGVVFRAAMMKLRIFHLPLILVVAARRTSKGPDASVLANLIARAGMANRTVDGMCQGQKKAFAMAQRKLENDNLSLVVIGGSLPAGTECHDPNTGLKGRSCSYGARFVRELERRSKVVNFANRAVGGTTTGSAIPQLPFLLATTHEDDGSASSYDDAPDLLVIDYSVNDWQSVQDWSGDENEVLVHGRGGADLWTQDQMAADHLYQEVKAATEVMVQYLLKRHPLTALWLVRVSCCVPPRCAGGDRLRYAAARRAQSEVAHAYGIALWDFEDQLHGNCTLRAFDVRLQKHPPWTTHALAAEALFYSWHTMQVRLLELFSLTDNSAGSLATRSCLIPWLSSSEHRSKFATCRPLTTYDSLAEWSKLHSWISPSKSHFIHSDNVAATGTSGIRVVFGTWSLYADRPEKPGWITTTANPSAIDFDVRFGRSPRLTIVYERSYANFSTAAVELLHCSSQGSSCVALPGVERLRGIHSSSRNVTLTDVAVFNVKLRTGLPGGFGVPPFASNLVVRITSPATHGGIKQPSRQLPQKFKVRFVGSC